jgi:hypothetical protein
MGGRYIYAVYVEKKRIIKLINSDTFYNTFIVYMTFFIRPRVGNVSTIFSYVIAENFGLIKECYVPITL